MRNFTAAALLLVLLVSPAAAATWTVSGREVSYRERSDEESRLVFGAWKGKYGRTYGSVGEEERRYAVFKEVLRAVDQHNAAGEAGIDVRHVPSIGLNGLADLTTEEWNFLCNGRLPGLSSAEGRKERGGRSTRGTSLSLVVLHQECYAISKAIYIPSRKSTLSMSQINKLIKPNILGISAEKRERK